MRKLQEELVTARNEINDLRAQLDAAVAGPPTADNEEAPSAPQADHQAVVLKATLDQREAELKTLEADLNRRLEDVSIRESKSAKVLEKANDRVRKIRSETNEELDNLKKAHETELERLRDEKASAAASVNNATPQEDPTPAKAPVAASASDNLGEIIGLPDENAEGTVVREFIAKNETARGIVRLNIQRRTNNLSEQMSKAKAETDALKLEYEALKSEKPEVASNPVKEEITQKSSQEMEAELAKLKTEHEKTLKEALAKKEEVMERTATLKGKLKENQIASWKAKWAVIERAAQETPTEEIAKVYAIAKNPPKAENRPAMQPNTPAKQTHPQQPGQGPPATQALATPTKPSSTPLSGQQSQATPLTGQVPQANGTPANISTHASQPALNQQSNPFLQAGNTIAANPFLQAQTQAGRGLQQPGFTGQVQAPTTQGPQTQQSGRGRNEGPSTGLQAIRGALQSNIPRGGAGSGIPLPGGRGRGGQQAQAQAPNSTGPGASQIGRGGGRGTGRGRGNVQGGPNQGSPGRGNLNPGAQQFQPGAAGRGQKRGAEDEGEGGVRGGKRPRGRGQGGGGAAGGAAPATGGE